MTRDQALLEQMEVFHTKATMLRAQGKTALAAMIDNALQKIAAEQREKLGIECVEMKEAPEGASRSSTY